MRYPSIHLNGTSAERLLEQNLKAAAALDAALVALREAEPNGRDFYLQGSRALTEALAEHAARILAVENVLQSIEAISDKITEQMDA